ncbi:MAG: hypothetical protein NZ899_06145 [Thermoguttaceae bacterium]|nr:hypothetical protein [Thermoguttaceae bacterium]
MRSPFAFFRRHQKVLLAGLGVMAMFGFVILPVFVEALQVTRARNIVVATCRYGTIRESTLAELMRQRGVTLRFLNLVGEMLAQAGERPMELEQLLVQIGPATEDSVVNRWLLARFGQELGLSVDPKMVNEFIADVTRGKIPGSALEEMLDRQGISVSYLFQVLAEELLALRVRDLMFTSFGGFTPAQHWDYFQRLNRRAQVETVALPVERFVDQVTVEPSEAELRQFFEQHRYQVADPDLPTPGFLEPKRITLEYLKAPFDQFVEKSRQQVTDKDIEEYYEKNKDRLYRREPLPGTPPAEQGKKPDSQAPTEGQQPPQPPGSSPQSAAPAPSSSAQPTQAEPQPQASESPSDAGMTSPPAEATPGISPAPTEVSPPGRIPSPPGGTDAEVKGQAPAEGKAGPSPGEDKAPGQNDGPSPSGSGQTPGGSESAIQEPGDGDGGEQQPAQPASAEGPKEPTAQSQPPAESQSAAAGGTSQPEYIPLEKVREEIRTTLARQKARQEMEQLLNKFQAQLSRYREEKILYELEVKQRGGSRRPEPAPPNLEAIARDNGLEYKRYGPITNFEFAQLEIAQATTALGGSVLEMLFERLPLHRPAIATDFQGNQYLVWKIEQTESRIPSLDDPGMREKVLRTWKFIQARQLARAEAEKLAAEARQAKKPLAEVFASRQDIKVEQSEPFTWLTSTLPLVFWMQDRPRISQVKGVDRPGEEFMRTVFRMRPGDVGTAMNHPQTVAYVIRVVEIQPPEDILWQQFTTEPGRLYLMAAQDDIVQGYGRLVAHVREKSNFRWSPEWQRRRAERPLEYE